MSCAPEARGFPEVLKARKPGHREAPGLSLHRAPMARANERSLAQFTNALRLFSGRARTFLEAGFALKIIFSFVNGLMPSRAFVAGFFTTFSLSRPGSVNRPPLRRLFLIWPLSDSNTAATCLRDSSASLQIVATISDFVGAPPFFAITRLLVRKNAAKNRLRG